MPKIKEEHREYRETQPLPIGFYSGLLVLEEKYFKGLISLDLIKELIQLYAKCVEYYDTVRDPIKTYFLEKMQNTLINQKTMELLIKTKDQENYENEFNLKKIDDFFEEKQDIQLQDDRFPKFSPESKEKYERLKSLKKSISNRYSVSRKKTERTKKFNLFLELEEQKTNEIKNLDEILNDYNKKSTINDKIILLNINEQMDNFYDRIQKRKLLSLLKNNSFDPSFLSTSFYSGEKTNGLEEIPESKISITDNIDIEEL